MGNVKTDEILKFWIYFRIYLTIVIIVLVMGLLSCFCWFMLIASLGGIITAILWYLSIRKRLKEKGIIKPRIR